MNIIQITFFMCMYVINLQAVGCNDSAVLFSSRVGCKGAALFASPTETICMLFTRMYPAWTSTHICRTADARSVRSSIHMIAMCKQIRSIYCLNGPARPRPHIREQPCALKHCYDTLTNILKECFDILRQFFSSGRICSTSRIHTTTLNL